ncbi:MAG: RluA family pseudouridine synthase [Lachnospiraceae bacterium]|nr:RluA family pseudouridine synthase [Lachnospiraceae bacterium]
MRFLQVYSSTTKQLGRVRINHELTAGDLLKIRMPERKIDPNRVPPVKGDIDILYEDQDYIALNKPSGMVTHPTHGHHQDTLANLLMGYFHGNISCKVIGRLDKDTSGIVLFGKHRLAVSRLQKQQREGQYQKNYCALALWEDPEKPRPEREFRIERPMGSSPSGLMKQEIKENGDGKPAITVYRMLETFQNVAFLEIHTDTGRTHQIRLLR